MTRRIIASEASLKSDVTSAILFERVRSNGWEEEREIEKEREKGRKGPRSQCSPVGTPEYRSWFTIQTESNCEATIHTVAHSIATGGVSCRTIIWILGRSKGSPSKRRGFPLMIKRPCVTTVPRELLVPRESIVYTMWKLISAIARRAGEKESQRERRKGRKRERPRVLNGASGGIQSRPIRDHDLMTRSRCR